MPGWRSLRQRAHERRAAGREGHTSWPLWHCRLRRSSPMQRPEVDRLSLAVGRSAPRATPPPSRSRARTSLSGAASGNYILAQPTGLSANITPATLTYIATPEIVARGKNPTGLTGTVSGFVAGDTLANSTSGSLVWTTNATDTSPSGDDAIDGGGLAAKNYVFVQDPNSTFALDVLPQMTFLPEVAWLENVVLRRGLTDSSLPVSTSLVEGDNAIYLEGKGDLVVEGPGVRLPPQAPGTH